jgi:hypothetical protein
MALHFTSEPAVLRPTHVALAVCATALALVMIGIAAPVPVLVYLVVISAAIAGALEIGGV